MSGEKGVFEVEFRCHFADLAEAYRVLPFLKPALKRRAEWAGTLYGRELFKAGQVLRTGRVTENGKNYEYITWKGPDTGKFCNVRLEIGENITGGVAHSAVMELLGGKTNIGNKEEAEKELERLGYGPFMSWSGTDNYGIYKPAHIDLKLTVCKILKWPLIVEFEKQAATEKEALKCQDELYHFSRSFKLAPYIFKEEPNQLLYEKTFGGES